VGDAVLMTKTAGLEGTAILAHDKETELKTKLSAEMLEGAKALKNQISVVPEGMIAGRMGANSMHDATEGGILGALWELAEASGKGLRVNLEKIPVLPETWAVCDSFGLNPYRLISSGVMVITLPREKVAALGRALTDAGIAWTEVGTITEKDLYIVKGNKTELLDPPDVDELYRVL
jgi:hydrogenase expression/formation protein HypE